jgi:DNA modification methylase
MTYEEFILSKIPRAQQQGFWPSTPAHPSLKPHQRDIATWMCRGGRRACFKAFGLGKTRTHLQVAKWTVESNPGKKFLITCPLGVRHQFIHEDGPAMEIPMTFCQSDAEIDAAPTQIIICNYEPVRDGKITLDDRFAGWGLDEASVLRSFGSKTYQTFLQLGTGIPYRFVFTATPSPNRHKELIHYGGFLGVMDTGQALTRFFKRNPKKAGDLTLHPHMEEQFWTWLASWAVFMQRPSDLGYSDEGYDLPPITVHWHAVSVDHKKAWSMTDRSGQHALFLDKSAGLRELAEVKRDSILSRLAKAREIMAEKPDAHWIIWHDLEDERREIERCIPAVKTVYGTQDLDEREDIILRFSRGEFSEDFQHFASKPVLAGSGCNLQRHCCDAIFLGASYKFNDVIQAVHRIQRFQQPRRVNVHFIYTESEDPVVTALKAKWAQHNELVAKMSELLRKFKLDLNTMEIKRTIGCDRIETASEKFRAIHNDCVLELETWTPNQVDLIVTSIPFGNQYEYSPSFNDFGHNPDNGAFFEQMNFLAPLLLKVLRPGRLACIHVKDRIRFGGQHGTGVPTVDRFSDRTADCFEKHGFFFLGRITIDTDVVRENAQTYRLGWSENAKDSTKMGVGMPEYVLLFRKPQTDLSNAYADLPVTKDKGIYLRAHWQVDAASFWKSNGDRLLDPDILANMPMDAVREIWIEYARRRGYSWKEHVEIAAALEHRGYLPASFMLFPPISNHPGVWTDISRINVLNSEQNKRNEENHVCPLQIDIVTRLINRYSNPGEIILDPFAGIFTVPYSAIHMHRIGWGIELSPEYWRCGVGYCEQAEAEHDMPTLFDLQSEGMEAIAK